MRMKLATFATVLGLLGLSSTAFAQGMAPAVMPMQGFLTDSAGTAIDGDVDLTITIYDGQTSTTELYGETQTVMVDDGAFTAYVGEGTPTGAAFDLAIFRDNSDTWVGIAIDGGTELPRFQLGSVPYAGFAQYSNTAGNAVQLGGMPAANYATTADAQARVTGTCTSGEAIVGINPDGTVNCASVGTSISHTCPANQAIVDIATDGTVSCAPFGDIAGVAAGTGLSGGGASGAVTLSADTTYLQRRVSGTCPGGEAIRSIAADGSVACGPAVNRQRDMTRASRIPISSGETISVGCYLGGVSGDFIGTTVECHTTWYCPTGGYNGMTRSAATLTSGDNYILSSTSFSPSVAGYCIVTSEIEFDSSYTLTGASRTGAPYFRVGYNDGTDGNDNQYGHYP